MLYHPTLAHFQRALLTVNPANRIADREARIAAVKAQLAKRPSSKLSALQAEIAARRKAAGV